MSVRVELTGIEELKQALRNLPQRLHDEAMVYVREATEGAVTDVKALYAAHKVTGNLGNGVRSEYPSSTVAVGIAKSSSKHAHLFEYGSQVRKTLRNANRGRMPAAGTNGAVAIYQRRRRAMQEQLIAMVRREGFQVTNA